MSTEKPDLPWFETDLRELLSKLRGWPEIAATFVVIVFVAAGLVVGGMLGLAVWKWSVANPEVSTVLGVYVLAPFAILWVAVRIVRHAWTGR